MSNFFTDNMVLQRNAPIKVWGFADAGEKVNVKFKNESGSTVADASGKWMIKLRPEKAGGPFEMTVSGSNKIVLKNILIGDVWLASGQSNMEWPLKQSEGYEVELSQKQFPVIRQIKIAKEINTLPQNNILQTEWKVANSSTIGEFSGVAYFFAKKIFNETKVPIGIINSTWGGTNIETWISREGFKSSEYFREMISEMPKINIGYFTKYSVTKKAEKIERTLGMKTSDFNADKFLQNGFDDSKLYQLPQPSTWENEGFDGLDGIVWLRKTVTLSEEDKKSDAKLYLTKIDDGDVTYFNGTQIGQTSGYDIDRIYSIPKSLLKIGKNIITVKITDNGGGGGIWGEKNNLKLETSGKNIPLYGNWGMAVEKIEQKINENDFPSLTYNAMIAPLEGLSLKGFIWYQGESNAQRAAEYKKSFPLLINSWRKKFGKDLPFYFVQLSTFKTDGNNSNEGSDWAELREAQTETFNKIKNTGMVVTTDIGNPLDIHPRNKKTVGERLANIYLKNGKISPVYAKHTVKGNIVKVTFTPAKKLLQSDNLNGFEITGKDQIFYPANAKTVKNTVEVWSDQVPVPVSARYGWKGDDSEINLFTEEGLPVSPFRTDNFKLKTEGRKYQINLK